jgi:fibronectin type 3 domain-containing protein
VKFKLLFWGLVLFLPTLAFADAWPLASSNSLNYWEDCDAGRTSAASANYTLSSSVGGSGNTSTALHQGYFFNVCRDLVPPSAISVLTISPKSDGTVDLNWGAVTDQESNVWGYRVYRTYYYGPVVYQTRLIDAPDNIGTHFTDAADMLAGIQYFYEVRPVDCGLNEQVDGNVRKPVLAVKQARSVVDLVALSRPGGDIALAWSPVAGSDYYNVYRSVTYGAKGVKINPGADVVQPSYLDSKFNLQSGIRYYYVVQSVASSVEENKSNNQASALSVQGGPNAPIITSKTHPIQGQASANSNPDFQWVRSSDPGVSQDMAGYYVKIDARATTGTAVNGPGWAFVTGAEVGYANLANGNWFFHCLGKDVAGNLGDEATYLITILATGTIRGTVTEQDSGRPAPGIVVEARLSGSLKGQGQSAADGTYHIDAIEFGNYALRFNRFGYKPLEIENQNMNLANSPLTVNAVFHTDAVIDKNQSAAYPNPAQGSEVRMIYYCEEPSDVVIEIYNVAGQMVARIKDSKPSGYQYSIWPLSSVGRGVYMFRAVLSGNSGKKIVLPIKKFSVIK